MNFLKNIDVAFSVFSGLGFGFQFIPGNEVLTDADDDTEIRGALLIDFFCFNVLFVLTKDAE